MPPIRSESLPLCCSILDSGAGSVALERFGICQTKHHKSQLSECHMGRFGQKYLASGIRISMRLWESEQPAEAKRKYETAGFVIEGKAELLLKANLCCWKKAILEWWCCVRGCCMLRGERKKEKKKKKIKKKDATQTPHDPVLFFTEGAPAGVP